MAEDEHRSNESRLIELLKKMKPEEAANNPAIIAVLKPEQRAGLLELLENEVEKPKEREKHEIRMQAVMVSAARASGLEWTSDCPTGHPFRARLDGALLFGGKRVAVVELETKNRKQVDGALLDLLTHSEPKKVLVLGRSKTLPYPSQLKTEILEEILPVLQKLLKVPAEIGVFTESELRLRPNVLAEFVGVGDVQ